MAHGLNSASLDRYCRTPLCFTKGVEGQAERRDKMDIWMLFAGLLLFGLVVSALPARTPPPQRVIVLQALEAPAEPAGSGCLPLLFVVAVIGLAAVLL